MNSDKEKQGSDPHLYCAGPQDEMTHPPEMGGLQFQADEKEHHHHTEFGVVHNVLSCIADQAEEKGTDRDAGQEVSQDRSHAEPFGDGNEEDRRPQVDKGVL